MLAIVLQSANVLIHTGEGAINVAVGQNRSQEVRVNGPLGAPGQMRMDVGFSMQQGQGNYSQVLILTQCTSV